jgi:serine/threonine-protein kinase
MATKRLASGRYAVERRLGHGGMATVYLARDEKLGRQVAVKILAENLAADQDFRDRFMREARLAARLSHPNVVQVFDVGEDDDERPYIVMEYVDGRSVADLLKRGRGLPPEKAVPLLAQAVAGLEHAHQVGLVHRDMKPHNLLLRSRDGRLKIADFGIARALEETGITGTGSALGTAPYMAPEQLEGKDPTPATDVYSCGVVAWEMLTGHPPHQGASPSAIARSRRKGRLPSLRRAAGVPPDLEALIRRCLRERPRDRFRDAGALRKALADVKLNGTRAAETLPLQEPHERSKDTTEATAPLPSTTATRRLYGRLPGGRVLAVGVITVMAIVGLAFALGSDDSGLTGEQRPAPAREPVEPAPQLQDPADQARALADWIRERAP